MVAVQALDVDCKFGVVYEHMLDRCIDGSYLAPEAVNSIREIWTFRFVICL